MPSRSRNAVAAAISARDRVADPADSPRGDSGTVSTVAAPAQSSSRPRVADRPLLWGLAPAELHDRFWAARGVKVVRRDEAASLGDDASFYLLTESNALVTFDLSVLMGAFNWFRTKVLVFRLSDQANPDYREIAVTDDDGKLVEFQRVYRTAEPRETRVLLTRDRGIAELWQASAEPDASWRLMFQFISPASRVVDVVDGRIYEIGVPNDEVSLLKELMTLWARPDATVPRVRAAGERVWADRGAEIDPNAKVHGPLWLGCGRTIGPGESAVGAAVLWDAEPTGEGDDAADGGAENEASADAVSLNGKRRRRGNGTSSRRRGGEDEFAATSARTGGYFGKRAFDIVFSFVALCFTLPLYPFIMLAIFLEDGRPFFFAHRRETVGGKDFPCLKFRTMRRDAEEIKKRLLEQNQVDGPQFYMENDPRILRVGPFLRKLKLDELPQFLNVLVGHMSVVGPRPSPLSENQFCPAWRDARLSVRPGITGLWQVRRTRREGLDFQEWVQYDLEYVKNTSFAHDLWILWRTVFVVAFGRY